MKRKKRHCGQIFLLISGIVLINTGILIFVFFENIYEFTLRDALKFGPNSKAYQAWRTNDPPLDMDIFVFNWTNPEEIRDTGTKPRFEEVGPYRFKEVKEKVNITWNNNETISYRHRKMYFFDPENSVRDLSDVITMINVVPLTAAYQVRHFSYFWKKVVSLGLTSASKLSVTKTAREILFDGYEENLLTFLNKFPFLNIKDKFGFFYGKNGTIGSDGDFSMSIPTDDNFGKIVWWNYKNRTDFYQGHCNDVRGSAGEFHPFNRKRDKLVLFSSELCKYAELEYETDVVIKGVRGYKFSADNIFDNGTKRPENSCFCKGECIPSGVSNVSACRQDSPSFLSLPHFFAADPYYTGQMEGLRPERDKHEFYITVEPKSGIVMDIAARMQVNMLLQPVQYIRLYEDVPKVFVPLFYFTQKIELNDELAANLRLIQNLPEYANYASLIFLSLGVLLVLWTVSSVFCCRQPRREEGPEKAARDTQVEEVPLNEKH